MEERFPRMNPGGKVAVLCSCLLATDALSLKSITFVEEKCSSGSVCLQGKVIMTNNGILSSGTTT